MLERLSHKIIVHFSRPIGIVGLTTHFILYLIVFFFLDLATDHFMHLVIRYLGVANGDLLTIGRIFPYAIILPWMFFLTKDLQKNQKWKHQITIIIAFIASGIIFGLFEEYQIKLALRSLSDLQHGLPDDLRNKSIGSKPLTKFEEFIVHLY